MSDEESIDDPLLREEQQRLDRLHRRNKAQGRIFTAGLCFIATAFAVLVLCSGRNGIATFVGAVRAIVTSTGTGAYDAAITFVGTVRTAITSTGTGAYDAAATFVGTVRTIVTSTGTGAYNAAATVGSKIGSGASSVSYGTYNAAATFGWEIFQIWNDAMLAVGSAVLHVGGGIATFASSSKEAAKLAMFRSPVLLDCFQDSPGATDDFDGASSNHWSLKTAPAIKAHWNVKSACDNASSIPKPCPNHARCAGGLVIDCQATDKTGLFVVSKETYANCVLSSKGQAIVDSIQSQLIDLAVEGKCDGVTSGNGNGNVNSKSALIRSKGVAHSTSVDEFAAAVHLSVGTLQLLGPHLDPDIVEYVPGSSIGISPNFAANHLDNQLPSSCRQQLEQITKTVQEKIIELVVLHQCKGIEEGHVIDHVVEVDGSIAFSIDGLVEAFAKDPGTTDISRHTFELVMPSLIDNDIAKYIPRSSTNPTPKVGLARDFVKHRLSSHLPFACWFRTKVWECLLFLLGMGLGFFSWILRFIRTHPFYALCAFAAPQYVYLWVEEKLFVAREAKIVSVLVRKELDAHPEGAAVRQLHIRDDIGQTHPLYAGTGFRSVRRRKWMYRKVWLKVKREIAKDGRFRSEKRRTERGTYMEYWVVEFQSAQRHAGASAGVNGN